MDQGDIMLVALIPSETKKFLTEKPALIWNS